MTAPVASISPRNILINKPSALGDVVHTLPVLNLLRRRWPEARISWLINSAFADLLDGHPQLNEVIPFDRKGLWSWWWNPIALYRLQQFIAGLRARKFDLVIDLQGLFRSGWMTALTGAPMRVGFSNAREYAHLFYTHHVPIDSMEQHAIERYLAVTEFLGCGRAPVEFPFFTDGVDREIARQKTHEVDRYAVVLPGTNWATKRWPVEKFVELVKPLREQLGLAVVIAGASDAWEASQQITELARPNDPLPIINLVGQTTLRQLVALIDRAQLVIANDSGPMHIAAALGKPLVTMFGATNPVRTGPYGRMESVVRVEIPCSPCYSRHCSHTSCMKWISTQNVLDEALVQINGNRRG